MDRLSEAKELRKKGYSIEEIAEKMGVCRKTVYCYLYMTRKKHKEYRKRLKERKLQAAINKELKRFNLPLEWNNEVFSLAKKYVLSRKWQGIPYSVPVRAMLQLLCRKYRVPSPVDLRRLTVKYVKYPTSGRKHSYFTILKEIDGVQVASPSEYIKNFFSKNVTYRDKFQDTALKISNSLPRHFIQGKNPRILAAACIYASSKGVLTQKEISDFFQITEVALRYTLRKIEKL